MVALIVSTIVATILSMILYRAGGQSKDPSSNPKWMPMWLRHSWVRDAGCTLISIGWALINLPIVGWWWYILAAGAQYGFTTTYFDTAPFNWMKPNDNFYLHGFAIGISFMFICAPAGLWLQCLIHSIAIGLFMGIWCAIFGNDVVEEFGRGGSIQAFKSLIKLIKF